MSEEKTEKVGMESGTNEPVTDSQEGTPTKDETVEERVSEDETKIKMDLNETEKSTGSPRTPKSRPESKSDKSDGRKSSSLERPSRPTSSDPATTDGRPKSTTSSVDGPSDIKVKKKTKKGEIGLEGHEVTFTITISIAVPTGLYSCLLCCVLHEQFSEIITINTTLVLYLNREINLKLEEKTVE